MTTCVTYLSFITFETGFCKTDREFEERLRSNPFYGYAARNWGHHAPKDRTPSPVISFLQSDDKVEASSQALVADKEFSIFLNYRPGGPMKLMGLHLGGYLGVSNAVDTLLTLGYILDPKDSYGRIPLWYAARDEYNTIIELLLVAGADVNAADIRGKTVLQTAARGGQVAVIEKLLAPGADVNAASAADGRTTALQDDGIKFPFEPSTSPR